MARQLTPLFLSDEERAELRALVGRRKTAQALALRARIILACAEGGQNKEVAAKLGVVENTVGKWRRRFVQDRVEGLRDEPRTGAPRTIDDARIEATIVKNLGEPSEECDPLELARHGEGKRAVGLKRAAHLASLRLATSSDGDVQALDRPGFRGQRA